MAEGSWPVHSGPRISELTFARALGEGPKTSPATSESGAIYKTFLAHGIDPSFALGMFWVESLFGTAGWNIWSDPQLKSWGNVLWVNCQVKDVPGVGKYEASNNFDYAYYPSWEVGAEDFCRLLDDYRRQGTDSRYGDVSKVYGATAKWPANPPGSADHTKYLNIVLGRMNQYDLYKPQEGEMAVTANGLTPTSNKKYYVEGGDRWYVMPGGTQSYAFRKSAMLPYFGKVLGSNWVQVLVHTGRFSSTTDPTLVYLPNFKADRVVG